MKVSEVMTRQVELASPDDTLQKAAGRMAELDVGVLPVGEGDRLVGIVSLGDVAVYADSKQTDAAVSAVSEPGGPHTQGG